MGQEPWHGLHAAVLLCFAMWHRLGGRKVMCSCFFPCRYFVLDFEAGLLQYFVNEQSKHQKPRGVLSLCGAIVSLSDEAPHMLVVYSASGEMYKLRGTFWPRCVGFPDGRAEVAVLPSQSVLMSPC